MPSLKEIAEVVDGKVKGKADVVITGVSTLHAATQFDLSFYADKSLNSQLKTSKAGVVMLRPVDELEFSGNKILVGDPYLAYAKLSQYMAKQSDSLQPKIAPSAVIDDSALYDSTVSIGALCVIEQDVVLGQNVVLGHGVILHRGVKIADNTRVDSHVTIYRNSQIGKNCHLSSGVVIGSSGFGYASENSQWLRIEQNGNVIIGDNVDIGANTTIDRGAIENTIVGNGVKLDNQIQIAHNVQIGDNTIMAGCVAVAGSTTIGERCQFGGRVSILGHLTIVDDVYVNADSFVSKSILKSGYYSSMIPVREAKQWNKIVARLNRLTKRSNL